MRTGISRSLAALLLALTALSCGSPGGGSGVLTGNQRAIEVKARRFAYNPDVITVNEGEIVVINLISEDVTHGFFLDAYGLQAHVRPGQAHTLSFTATKSGKFIFRCSVTCGSFHPYMVGHLKVLPNRPLNAGLVLVSLLGLTMIILHRKRDRQGFDKLFGLFSLSWRFELTQFRPVRALLKSRWFPLVLVLANTVLLVVILAAAFMGGFSAGNSNFGVMMIWVLWWVLLMTIFVPLLGRFWCMMCPFPLFGDWLQRGKILGVGRLRSWGLNKKWPRKFRNLWPVTIILFVTTFFFGFFTVSPLATFVLIGGIVLAAVVIAGVYEKRTFCLYVCPVSGFQGLYANFAATEVRVKDPEICKDHVPKTCCVGNDCGYGCPWMELPFDLNRNTYCGLCMECFKSCPHDNMALNIRTFGADLLTDRKKTDDANNRRGMDEAFKSLTMIGVLFAFFLTMQGPYGWLKDMARVTTLDGYGLFLAGYTLLNFLLVPGLFLLVSTITKFASGSRQVAIKEIFINFSYSLIPIGLARWAAFSLGIILPNVSYLMRNLSDPLSLGWDLFGTANYPWEPVLTGAMPHLQTVLLLVGLAFSLEFGFKFAQKTFADDREAFRGWLPMAAFLVGLSLFFVWLLKG